MSHKNQFCHFYINKYIECLRINMNIFGPEHGIDMCNYIYQILDHSDCPIEKIEPLIGKFKSEQNNKNK